MKLCTIFLIWVSILRRHELRGDVKRLWSPCKTSYERRWTLKQEVDTKQLKIRRRPSPYRFL